MEYKDTEMTYITGGSEEQLLTCGFNTSVCYIRIKPMLYYIYLTKDEDVKQQCVISKGQDPPVSNIGNMLNIYLLTCKPSFKI